MSDHAPDLRITICHECGVEVTQAGGVWWHVSGGRRWVKRPACGECKRTPGRVRVVNGKVVSDALGWSDAESSVCPSCGGSGFGRLVALDGAHRIKLCSQSGERMWGNKCAHPDDDPCEPMYVWFIRELADGVLAALEGGDTDV